MKPPTIDQKLLRKLLRLAGDRLEGRWVLVGGTLLPCLGVEHRSTTDIDLVGLGPSGQSQALALMSLAEELGLPVESVNQAAGYFLHKQPSFEDHLLPLHRGKSAEILRPNLFLFLCLKIGRLSESDLEDCREFLRLEGPLAKTERGRVLKLLELERKKCGSVEKEARIQALYALIQA